ncbi:MAG: integrase [Verrucomicrobiales bacterium]|jgi:integrase
MSKSAKTWNSTRYQYLYRHQSGTYYARLTVNSRKTWRSLRTTVLAVARAELASILEEESKRAELDYSGTTSSLTFKQAAALRLERVETDISTKASTKKYQREIHGTLFRFWPKLASKDVSKITGDDCRKWAASHGKHFSPTRFNAALGAMKQIFELTIEKRLRFTNPARDIKRAKSVQKDLGLLLPEPDVFAKWVAVIRTSPSRYGTMGGDWVEFQSYSGLRPDSESPFVTWRHCDFKHDELVVTGSIEKDGTKNRQIRRIPMNGDLRNLLRRMRSERSDEPIDSPILECHNARHAMRRAADIVGMKYLRPYDLRHLFATRCLESGVDAPTVAAWLGHKDKGALLLRTYNHIRKPHSHAAAKLVSFTS